MQKAALHPYSIEQNCSNSLSVGSFTSPNQVFPIRMFNGLLFLIPLGIIFFFIIEKNVEFGYIVFQAKD